MRLDCHDVCSPDCHFTAKGKTREKVKHSIMKHVKKSHNDTLRSMSKGDRSSMEEKIDRMIH